MKTVYSIALGLLMVWATYGQTFKKAEGSGTDVTISKKGEIFVVGTSKQIFKYDFKIEDFRLHSKANRSAKAIAAAQEKFSYLLTNDGRMHITYATNDSRIGAIGSLKLIDIYVGENNALWGVDTRGAVKRYSSSWQPFSIAGNNNKKVCVNNSGRVFTLKNDNTIYEYYNGATRKLPGAATDITYDHAQKKLYVLGTSKRFFVWNPGRKNWDLVKNTRNDFKSIAAHNGQLWGTTTRNEIYTTANVKKTTSNNLGSKKLKITLTKVECLKNGDGGNNADDYFLEFFTTLKVANRDFPFRGKEYLRLESEIEEYGENRNLYIDYRHRRQEGKLAHDFTWYLVDKETERMLAKRQLHVQPRKSMNINNSGYFELKGTNTIKESNSQFYIGATLSEITHRTTLQLKAPGWEITKIIGEKKKINLPLALDYLSKTKNKGDFSFSRAPYYRMGTGYAGLTLDEGAGGHRSMSGYFYGLSREDEDGTKVTREAKVHFTIELID